jgi:hypothetical protein
MLPKGMTYERLVERLERAVPLEEMIAFLVQVWEQEEA